MDIKVIPTKLDGNMPFIFSKSYMHRIIIASTLAKLQSKSFDCDIFSFFKNEMLCEDTKKTLDACKNICDSFTGSDASPAIPLIDCSDSATTLRLLLPVASVLFSESKFTMSEQLAKRPIEPFLKLLKECGCNTTKNFDKNRQGVAITSFGGLIGANAFIEGNISSQFISGLLFAFPLTKKGGSITIKNHLGSAPYVWLTCQVLKDFDIKISFEKFDDKISFTVPGNQKYKLPKSGFFGSFSAKSTQAICDNPMRRDWSLSALWFVADFLGSDIRLHDGQISNTCSASDNFNNFDTFNSSGAVISDEHIPDICILEVLNCFKTTDTLSLDCDDCPDLVPLLAVATCFRGSGTITNLTNLQRLKYKESNRIMSTFDMIQNLGGQIACTDDSITITSKNMLNGGTVDSYNDHRIAMAATIVATACENAVTIKNIDCIKKSYPDFLNDFLTLGGEFYEL